MGIFNSKRRHNGKEGGKTIVSEGCFISGEMTELKGPLHIDGRVEGIIDSEFDVSIGRTGQIKGLVKARSIVLSGVLDGKVACERLEILQTGKLIGEVISGEFTVETGGKFIGQSHEMTEGGMVVSLPETFAQLSQKKDKPSVLTEKKEEHKAEVE
ncbi:polymer-forming cytoskeletal protein [Thiomicrorhabdus sediminis]|uniref:Polymer-forming cytoskeletal protein n=2 Tax=Thiomicrorhabdus sediminis TaxID=2580412 RepID=A0A4P9K497_9GAMM|nr:polymer-forming cytoskeletal protein [Thiomicrorhabdus sediminis]